MALLLNPMAKITSKLVVAGVLISLLLFSFRSPAQIQNPVTWKSKVTKIEGDTVTVQFDAFIEKGWHIYAQQQTSNDGPVPLKFSFQQNVNFQLLDRTTEPQPKSHAEPAFGNIKVYYFEDSVTFYQKLVLNYSGKNSISASVIYMACNKEMCLPPETNEFTFEVDVSMRNSDKQKNASGNVLMIFIGGFIGGLLALLTPCVFSMIPLTVSYFSRNGGFMKALVYGVSIVIIYVAFGLTITLVFGADALNAFASNGFVNLIFFVVFVIFAISFFGVFEITLPSGWVNKSDKLSDRSGFIGIFFMAATLALVSFSCTGPIIGSLLVEAALSGNLAGPVSGMLGFSIALALPFMIFAAFPAWMNSLPKSGQWLNTIKVVLGFLELALAFKFLSTFDLVFGLGFLKREVFISIWIVIFFFLGLFLLGKINFEKKAEANSPGIGGILSSWIVFSFVVYLIPGLWGAPLKLVSGLLPPSFYKEWNQTSQINLTKPDVLQENHQTIACPHNLNCFHDFDEGMTYARSVNKPVLLDFTGWSCVNCRKMEDNVWSDERVLQKLKEDYVLISLYVDDITKLPAESQYLSKTTSRKVETLGNKWNDFQIEKFRINSQPFYVLLDTHENLLTEPIGYEPNTSKYLQYLNQGIQQFSNRKN